jgi:DNA-binding NtrC family response regulator
LRDRKEDIPPLIEQFVQYFGRNKNYGPTEFAPEVTRALTEYPWPGNVRELKNLVQRMIVLHGGSRVGLSELPQRYCGGVDVGEETPEIQVPAQVPETETWSDGKIDFNNLVSSFEDRLILQALTKTNGNKKEAAELLNLKRTTLLEKIKKKGIEEKNCSS